MDRNEQKPVTTGQASLEMPRANPTKKLFFVIITLLAAVVNVVCGVLNYSMATEGAILSGFYDRVANQGLAMYIWVAAGIGIVAVAFTVVAYILSFDYRRTSRPIVLLWLLWASFGVFLAGYLLAWSGVTADNVPVIAASGFVCLLLPIPVQLVERGIGDGFLKSAEKLFASGSPSAARAAARSALTFLPARPRALFLYGLSMARAGRPVPALPYLHHIEQNEILLKADTAFELGNAYEEMGDRDKALHYLELVDQEQPSLAVCERIIRHHLALGSDDAALAEMEKLSADDQRPWREELQRIYSSRRDLAALRGLCAAVRTDDAPPFAKTEEHLRNILKLFPRDIPTLRMLIDLLQENGQVDQAMSLREGLLKIQERLPDVRRTLIDYYWQHGRQSNVMQHLTRLLLAGEATTEEKLRIVEEHYSEGDYQQVEELVDREPDLQQNPRALLTLAYALYDGRRLDESLATIEKARVLNPSETMINHLDTLTSKIRRQNLENEVSTLGEKVKENPRNLDVKFEYFDRLVAGGNADKVIVELDDILAHDPSQKPRIEQELRFMLTRNGKNMRLMDFLGDLYLRDNNFDRAFELYEKRANGELDNEYLLHDGVTRILAQNPSHLPSLASEIHYFAGQNQPAEGLRAIDQYRAAGGAETAEILKRELDMAQSAGEFARAETAGKALLAMTPDDVPLLSRMARLASESGDFALAIRRLEAAKKADPDNVQHRRELRDVQERRNQNRMAEIQELLKTDPGNRALREELGDLYHDFNQLNEAISSYQRAAQNDPNQRVARAKLGYILTKKGLLPEADEVFVEADLRSDLPEEEQEKLKALFFNSAQLMEEQSEEPRALELYRKIFRVDAGYRNVVELVERLQHADKKKTRYS